MPRLAYAAPLALALALASASVRAQPAPGPEDAPPGMCSCAVPAPGVAAVVPALPRWSVGLRLTSIHTVDKDTNDKTDWGGGGVDAYYRIAPRWELGLEIAGARQQLPDGGGDGNLTMGMDLAMARFHPWPHAAWDLYALAGLGGGDIRSASSPDAKVELRTAAALGFGVERRFGHLAVSAELRSIGLSPVRQPDAEPEASVMSTGTTPAAMSDGGLEGGSFSLAASYEF